MKLLFTKLQEEITTVKKSVTQFRVETGSSDFKAAEFPVIELQPESQKIERAEANRPPKASLDDRKAPLALNAKAEQVCDVVDLQGISKKGALSPVTYSASGELKTKPCLEGFKNDSYSKLDNNCIQGKVSVYNKTEDLESLVMPDERRAWYIFTSRKFIATQEMIEYHSNREKKVSFELTI
jgi:hypothetical protein